jgi:hypothetical protein
MFVGGGTLEGMLEGTLEGTSEVTSEATSEVTSEGPLHGPLDEALEALDRALALLGSEDRSRWGSHARSARLLELAPRLEGLKIQVLRLVGEWDGDRSWEADGALSAPTWLTAHTQMSKREARGLVRTARLVHRHDRVGKAMAAGDMSSAHAEVLADAARGRTALLERDVDLLVDLAPTLPVDDYATAMKHWRSIADDEMARADAHVAFEQRTVTWTTSLDGRFELWASLDAEGGATVVKALEAYDRPDPDPDPEPRSGSEGPADGPRSIGQRLADGLVQLCSESLRGREQSGHATPGIDGLIDVERLAAQDGFLARGHRLGAPAEMTDWLRRRCEITAVGPVARAALIRLACDAAVGRVVMRGASEVLDVGRRTRVVGRALRRAIELRDGHCTFPGCDAPLRWCDVHHLVHWAHGGATSLDNCTLLCRRHHVLCHEGGWELGRAPDGRIVIAVRGNRASRRRRRGPPEPFDLAA